MTPKTNTEAGLTSEGKRKFLKIFIFKEVLKKRSLLVFSKLTPKTNTEAGLTSEGKRKFLKIFMIIKILLPIVYIQGSFDKKKFTCFLKTDAGNKQGSRAKARKNVSF